MESAPPWLLFVRQELEQGLAGSVEREDRALSATERAVIRAHAFICRRCTKWEAQVSFMRKSMKAWGNYRD